MYVGVDFGTTNSAISVYDGERVHAFRVDSQLPNLLPSLLYVARDFSEFTGTTARNTYLTRNSNRPSRFRPVYLGELEMTVGGASDVKIITQSIYASVDVLSPGRLLRSIKTALRNDGFDGTTIFGTEYSLEQLIAIILRGMLVPVREGLGRDLTHITLGRPVKFSHDPVVEARAETVLRAAAKLAGVDHVRFLPEPIAAAYAYHRDFDSRTLVFIFDFGGGTLDLTLAWLGGDAAPEIVATEGVLIGGDDFDRVLIEMLLPYFGRNARLSGDRPLPAYIWKDMLDWQTAEALNHSDGIEVIKEAMAAGGSSDPKGMTALYTLISQNLYYKLLHAVEVAKIKLSSAETTTISFHESGIHIDETLTRAQFERLISHQRHTIGEAIEALMQKGGVSAADVQFLVPTGGSSEIPLFKKLLADAFPDASTAAKKERTLTGVVQGLGIYSHEWAMQNDSAEAADHHAAISAARAKPDATLEKSTPHQPFSFYIAGLNAKNGLQCRPWQKVENSDLNRPSFKQAVFAPRDAKILVASTLQRFILTDVSTLHEAALDPENMVYELRMDTPNAEEFALIMRWSDLVRGKGSVLISRSGIARYFDQKLVAKPLREVGFWKLSGRGKADPPTAFVSASRYTDLMLMSRGGRGIRFPVGQLSVRGNHILRLKQPDQIYACRVTKETHVIAVRADGMGRPFLLADVPVAPKNGGVGKIILRNNAICGLLPASRVARSSALSTDGQLLTPVAEPIGLDGGWQPLFTPPAGETVLSCRV